MLNGLNFSVYLSEAERQLPIIESILPKGSLVFTSFHIAEEVDPSYREKAASICRRLQAGGYGIVADVSRKTLGIFGMDSIESFADEYGIKLLRIDYGYSDDELVELASRRSIVINCSTVNEQTARRLGAAPNQVYGLHNFYPRPETGLDEELFARQNAYMKDCGIEPMAFIAGDDVKRGPIYDGLPTLEQHRHMPPYAAYLELSVRHGVKGIFVGDGTVSQPQFELIDSYCRTGVIQLPARLDSSYDYLYGKPFTVRVDSPAWAARFNESREYATAIPNLAIAPQNCVARELGCITIDNLQYGRYQGEIQLMRAELPADGRVNVIGSVPTSYHPIVKLLQNGMPFTLVNC